MVINKLIVKLMLTMLMSILKTAKNLLQKILPQPGFAIIEHQHLALIVVV